MGTAIEMRNVSVVRDGTTILDTIDLDIDAGENIAIIGPNGSGKTTLMKLLRGEIHPYSREDTEFRLFGKKRWDLFELRSRIGIVSMDLQSRFDGTSDVGDVIMSGFFGSMDVYRNHEVSGTMREKVCRIGETMGLADKMDRDIGTVSLGEMRRALISRALVSGPEMLVLDEPMTGLDISVRTMFKKMFDSLIENGTGIVMITHELEDIPEGIGRIVMMKNGKIFADGEKKELLTSENVSRLYDAELKVECRGGSYHMYGA